MSATFDPALTSGRDHIRRRVFDCELADPGVAGAVVDPILQDETIDALISSVGFNEALAQCAESCAAYFSREPDRFVQRGSGGAQVTWEDRVKTLLEIARRARAEAKSPGQRVRRGIAIGRLAEETALRTD